MDNFSLNNSIVNSIDTTINTVCRTTRESFNVLGQDELFTPVFDISIRNEKERVLKKFKKLAEMKLVTVKDFRQNPENIFTMHEMLTLYDGSLATKFTVQFNLFGGTIIGLGSKKHEEYLAKIDNLSVIGCFCLTEVGYGNNAIEMESTAVYNHEKKEFVIDTPTVQSQKFWITNGAYHANHAVVFAQTYVNGVNEGINTFLIRIRNDDGSLAEGVKIDDMGMKMGLNGVDNARIILNKIKAPYDSLLDRISHINEEGKFISKISGKRARFIYAANRLLSGRLCIASMMLSSQKLALAITIKFAKSRLSNGKSGKSDTPIFNYQIFQNQIIPLLSRTLIYNVGLLYIRNLYSNYIMNEDKYDSNYKNEMIRLCCVIKPMICWHCNVVGNICRERVGGQGFLSINNIEQCISGAHSGITAEGDSSVLMQKVSKEYVEDYIKGVVKEPKAKYTKNHTFNQDNLLDLDLLISLISLKEGHNLKYLAEKTIKTGGNSSDIYKVWMLEESNMIQDLAMNYGKRICLEAFINSQLFSNKNQNIFTYIAILEASIYVKENLSFFIINEFINKKAAFLLEKQISNVIKEISLHADDIIAGFNLPKSCLVAPIYTGYQKYYSVDKTGGEHYNRKPKF